MESAASSGLKQPGRPDLDGITGPNCEFSQAAIGGPSARVGVNTKSDGIAGLYARREGQEVFEPTTVSGYPALFLNRSAMAGSCSINAAVNPDELVYASVLLEDLAGAAPGEACDIAVPLLEAIIAGVPK